MGPEDVVTFEVGDRVRVLVNCHGHFDYDAGARGTIVSIVDKDEAPFPLSYEGDYYYVLIDEQDWTGTERAPWPLQFWDMHLAKDVHTW